MGNELEAKDKGVRILIYRFHFAACVSFVAWSFAAAMGVPIWRDGWGLNVIGDRTDIAVCSFVAAWLLDRALTPRDPLPEPAQEPLP
jgi:hypothetical protein